MSEFDFWYNTNKHALDELYYKLIFISKSYSIIIIDNDKSYNNFLIMMYNESSKKVITPLFTLRGVVAFFEDLHFCSENSVRRR